MKPRGLALSAVVLGVGAALAGAQAPPPLELPVGLPARAWTAPPASARVEGRLVRADVAAVTLVPKGAPPLSRAEVSLPTPNVRRLEVALGTRRHARQGALVGALLGVALALTDDVDPELCRVNESVSCSRGEALLDYGLGAAVLGAAVGALIETERFTPVDLGALGPAAPAPGPGRRPTLQLRLRF